MTYGELDLLNDRFAWFLNRRGLVKGDRVALYLQNCPQYVICQLGAPKAGAIVVPCGPMFKAWELAAELSQTGAKTIVCQDELYPNVEEAGGRLPLDNVIGTGFADCLPAAPVELPEAGAGDVCLLQFTSGATGLHKGAMLTHANQLYKSAAQALVYKYTPDDVMLTAMPIYHIAGMLWGLAMPIYIGCTMVIMARFDPAAMALAIHRLRVTKMYATVTKT